MTVQDPRSSRMEAAFAAALESPAADRDRLLESLLPDPESRAEVIRLLRRHEALEASGEAFLAQLDSGVAGALLTPAVPLPETIGRYRVTRRLARGGNGVVYLAHDPDLDRPVAVKVLPPERLGDATARERLKAEARTISALDHPHIATIYEIGHTPDGDLFIAMAYYEGVTLRTRVAQGPLPLSEALRIGDEIAGALAAAHAKGIIHRDVKPENIVLTEQGARLLDFGIATMASSTGSLAGVGGTLAYMSPEQSLGETPAPPSDVWALGVVLYEMLTGRRPFTGETPDDLVAAVRTADPVPVRRLRPGVSEEISRVVLSCLDKNPAGRPPDAGSVLPLLTAPVRLSALAPSPRGRPRRFRLLAGGLSFLLLAILLVVWQGEGAHLDRYSIAVLPFQYLGPEGPDAYIAAGLHDDLLTQLARVPGFSLRGRASVMGYAGTDKSIQQIGAELNVGTVVQANAQIVGDRLRYHVEVVDVAANRTLWAQQFEQGLDETFAIQGEIAQQVVRAVGAIGQPEPAEARRIPSTNAESYRLFLQGRTYQTRPGFVPRNWEIAQQLYERALSLDSSFALAHAALSEIHGRLFWFRVDPSPERRRAMRREAEAALRLAPGLPEAHRALGQSYYFGDRDFPRALEQFTRARAGLPNDADLLAFIGYALRRLGRFDKALAALDTAIRLDPLNTDFLVDRGALLVVLGRITEGLQDYDRALILAPDNHFAAATRALVIARVEGTDSLRAVLTRLPADASLGECGTTLSLHASLLHWERQADSLLALALSAPKPVFAGESCYFPPMLYAAWAHVMRGDPRAARQAYRDALTTLDSALTTLPEDWRIHVARAWVLAGLGRQEEALRETDWMRRFDDAWLQVINLAINRAQILAWIGREDEALDEIERLQAGPSMLPTHALRSDPLWDPLRHHPRFQRLVERRVSLAAPRP